MCVSDINTEKIICLTPSEYNKKKNQLIYYGQSKSVYNNQYYCYWSDGTTMYKTLHNI